MEKIFFIDIDGTLLDDNDQIHELNLEAIKMARENGDYVVLCSGRTYKNVSKISELVGASEYVIGNNGGSIYNRETNDILQEASISYNEIEKIIELREKYNLDIFINLNGRYLIDRQITNFESSDDFEHQIVENVRTYLESLKDEFPSIPLVGLESTSLRRLRLVHGVVANLGDNIYISNESKEIRNIRIPGITRDGEKEYFMDLSVLGFSKDNAIRYLCDYLSIPLENAVAIGDSYNDLPMFDVCGTKVCVENGVDKLKEKADVIVPSNNDGGVGIAIMKIIERNFTI